MPAYTKNYNLKKPAQEENVNIDDINGNMDTIDEALARAEKKTVVKNAALSSAGWNAASGKAYGFTQTLTVDGVDGDVTKQLIAWSPVTAFADKAYECGIACISQAANALTFICDTRPSADIDIVISIQGVE